MIVTGEWMNTKENKQFEIQLVDCSHCNHQRLDGRCDRFFAPHPSNAAKTLRSISLLNDFTFQWKYFLFVQKKKIRHNLSRKNCFCLLWRWFIWPIHCFGVVWYHECNGKRGTELLHAKMHILCTRSTDIPVSSAVNFQSLSLYHDFIYFFNSLDVLNLSHHQCSCDFSNSETHCLTGEYHGEESFSIKFIFSLIWSSIWPFKYKYRRLSPIRTIGN